MTWDEMKTQEATSYRERHRRRRQSQRREIRKSGATPREEEYGGGLAHERGVLYVVGARPAPRA